MNKTRRGQPCLMDTARPAAGPGYQISTGAGRDKRPGGSRPDSRRPRR